MQRHFVPLCLSLFLLALPLPGQAQTTTYTAETANNTSACSNDGNHLYCGGPFVGFTNSDYAYNPPPGNVSSLPLRQILYSGSTTKAYVAFMPWFDKDSSGCVHTAPGFPIVNGSFGSGYTNCNGHVEIGYTSNDANTVDAQISDMLRRGFDGISI